MTTRRDDDVAGASMTSRRDDDVVAGDDVTITWCDDDVTDRRDHTT